MKFLKLLWVIPFLMLSCAHSPQEKMKRDYQNSAENRIDDMQDNIKQLEKRSEQLLGEPKLELTSAIDKVKAEKTDAEAQLKELKARDASTWVEKKASVDQSLSEMEEAYNGALSILAH